MFGKLGAHAVRIRVALVDLVDGHDDRHAGGARVLNGLDRLRHDSIVRCHHEHDDVGRLRAAGAHGRECRMPRGVEKGDDALGGLDVVGADVLGDATRLAGGDLRRANEVEE